MLDGVSRDRWARRVLTISAALASFALAQAGAAATLTVQYGIPGNLSTPAFTIQYTATGPTAVDLSGPSTVLTLGGTGVTARGLVGQPGQFNATAPWFTGGSQPRFSVKTGTAVATGLITGIYGTAIPVGYGQASYLVWPGPGAGPGSNTVLAFRFGYGPLGLPLSPSITPSVGAEVARTFVPEPATGSLVLLGVTCLAGLAAAGRRRSPR